MLYSLYREHKLLSDEFEIEENETVDGIIRHLKRDNIWNGEVLTKSKVPTELGFDLEINDFKLAFIEWAK